MSDTPAPYAAADGLVRVYPAPRGTAEDGCGLVWMHGGGFAGGDLDMPEADAVARSLAEAGVTVVSVDYRLAPLPSAASSSSAAAPARGRAPFPAASDDVLDAWRWTVDTASDLGIAPARLAIGGASAGANLAAGAVLRLIETDERMPSLVVLAYPTLLAVQPAPGPALRAALDADPGADRFGHAAVLAMYENYLGGSPVGAPLAAVPGLATPADLASFPATVIVASDVDELRVSAEIFAATLRTAGRPVAEVVEPGTQHGHLNRPDEAAASDTLARFAAAITALPASPSPSASPGPSPSLVG